jgi:hypothetical protein
MEPDRPVVAGDICHPVCGRRSSLCCELHVSINLADVLHEFGVRDNVTCGLVVQELPSIGYSTVCLRKNGALVSAGDGAILVVFGALGWPVTFELDGVLEEGPVCCFVFGEGISDPVPIDGMDKLTHTLVGLL